MMGTIDRAAGEGELVERRNRRRKYGVYGALFAAGFPSGVYLGYRLASDGLDLSAPWDPTFAILMAAMFLLALLVGSLVLSRQLDEVDRSIQLQAGTAAAAAYLVTYPTWFILWKGGFVPEPIHWALFILFWVVLLLASLYYRFR